jgi:hypothetical protein
MLWRQPPVQPPTKPKSNDVVASSRLPARVVAFRWLQPIYPPSKVNPESPFGGKHPCSHSLL